MDDMHERYYHWKQRRQNSAVIQQNIRGVFACMHVEKIGTNAKRAALQCLEGESCLEGEKTFHARKGKRFSGELTVL